MLLAEITSLYQFMSDSPWLTFFICLITLQAIVYIARYICYAIKGYPPPDTEEEDDVI